MTVVVRENVVMRTVYDPRWRRLLYVVLAIYAPGFMSTRVAGNINLGLVLGLLQFVTTFGITAAYVRFANRTLDPQATALREDLESQQSHRAETTQEARP